MFETITQRLAQSPETVLVLLTLVSVMLLHCYLHIRQSRLVNRQISQGLEQALQSSQHQQQQWLVSQLNQLQHGLHKQLTDVKVSQLQQLAEQDSKLQQRLREDAHKSQQLLHQFQQEFLRSQNQALEHIVDVLTKTNQANREEQAKSLNAASEMISAKVKELTGTTDNRLKEISEQVDKRLMDGFEKTSKTFTDIVKRLALIDDAQKKITELSSNVVSLQEVLSDKRSRGAFGEVQLNGLIRNVMPEQHFSLQHTLSNGKIADCILWLPEPTGNVVIDAKFPLESYKRMTNLELGELDRKAAERQFKADIKKHVEDISSKYLIDGETADGAIMFIPAEAIFAEIHSQFPDIVEHANKSRVWITSPTTLMAVLTTARAVLKDEATREQVHVIKAHLGELSKDFGRFKQRFGNLARHIEQASTDVKQIHTSADKITARFDKIEQVDIASTEDALEHVLNE